MLKIKDNVDLKELFKEDEIKEMLDYLKDFIEEDRLEQINLNRRFISSLLNYITNLQESEAYYYGQYKDYKSRIDKANEIYKNRNTCKYKKERFMKDKSTSDLMFETLTGGDDNE